MNKVYHVKTQEDCDALMNELEEKGCLWWGSNKPATQLDFWWMSKEDTCVKLEKNRGIFCGGYDTFKGLGYEITEYKAPIETVGSGRNRKQIDHTKHHFMSLCRKHHQKETVYHTSTQEDFNALMEKLEEKGVYAWWWSLKRPRERLELWGEYMGETCVRVVETKLLQHSDLNYYKSDGFEIIEYKAPKKEKKAMKLENLFTSKCDEYENIWGSQKFCTKAMKDKQSSYESALKLESRARNIRQRVLKDLEETVAEERKALLENVERLDKALKGSAE
ncbi:putative HNHc nuclease [Vagococcus entomophilus]|uniref:Uncharacterized protein n=1 Tax=Vagococcus entomophilus TaxID=1160095 RepID=A0A430AK25_9ENTE|nr:putative HNHc nuclease [Vagococcus entomophilus]RSU08456.1 hypothetical protein CBF30_04240 [Vagococcus entomophilus]